MYVWQVLECEEYSFQQDHGLWATEARAIADASERCHAVAGEAGVTVLRLSDDEVLVLKGRDWTVDTFNAHRKAHGSYWWYRSPFNHTGVLGVFRVEVQE